MSKTIFGHFVTCLAFYARLGSPKVTISHITPSIHVEDSHEKLETYSMWISQIAGL